MAVKLRMKRMGNTHRPFYRVVSVDQRKKRDGRVIEQLGTYDPLMADEGGQVKLDLARCAYWISVGAQPSETVASLLKRQGLKPEPGTPVDAQDAAKLTPAEPAAAEAAASESAAATAPSGETSEG
jgi:small subunit ribosomal protein S16